MTGVINGDDKKPKRDIELNIHENGGTFVQHPTNSTFLVIAAKKGLFPKSRKIE